MIKMWTWEGMGINSRCYNGFENLSIFSICGIIRGINSSLEKCLNIKNEMEQQKSELKKMIKELKKLIPIEEEMVKEQGRRKERERKQKEMINKCRESLGEQNYLGVDWKKLMNKLKKHGNELKRRKVRENEWKWKMRRCNIRLENMTEEQLAELRIRLKKQKEELKKMEEEKIRLERMDDRIMDDRLRLTKNKISLFRFINEKYKLWLWWLANFSSSFFKFCADESELTMEFWPDKNDKVYKIVIDTEGRIARSLVSSIILKK